jgi:hypothetical protein
MPFTHQRRAMQADMFDATLKLTRTPDFNASEQLLRAKADELCASGKMTREAAPQLGTML